MKKIHGIFRKGQKIRDTTEYGQGMVEYAFILVLVVVVVIIVLQLLGPVTGGLFSQVVPNL